jgi:hypothetical protein
MLFTDATWAESSAFRRAIAKPYQPWRCVGWTDEGICFWVFPKRETRQSSELPDGLLVVGPEVLIDIVAQMSPDALSVYVLQPGDQGRPAELQRLTELWSQPRLDDTMPDYWYRTGEGDLRPCSRLQHHVPNDAPLELAITLDAQACSDGSLIAI